MDILNKKNRILLGELVKTDFKLRYQGSAIGYLWSILRPLLLFLVMYVVFVRFLRFGKGISHWPVAMLLGTVIWTFFNEATIRSILTIVNHGGLLRKLYFSKIVIVLSEILGALINFGINLAVVFIFMLINGVHLGPEALLVVPLTIELLILTAGICMLLSTWYVKFRDIAQIWEVLMQAGFYATPIIYPLAQVEQVNQTVAKIILLNPISQILQDFRFVLMDNSTYYQPAIATIHSLWAFVPYVISFVIFGIGYRVFNKNSQYFAEIV
jgi:ABC-2 type transport system permease protein